jgi:hypothetical protein
VGAFIAQDVKIMSITKASIIEIILVKALRFFIIFSPFLVVIYIDTVCAEKVTPFYNYFITK